MVDNSAALENVSRFFAKNGFKTESRQSGENEWQISAVRDGSMPEIEIQNAPAAYGGKTVVLLTTENLGRGDDELGKKLMATFLSTLPELGPDLWRIILLNGAVKLSAQDGEALKHLKKLAVSGIEILVCGTCLSHYGLLDKKEVGETTNMMDVVSSLALAQKIIRP